MLLRSYYFSILDHFAFGCVMLMLGLKYKCLREVHED